MHRGFLPVQLPGLVWGWFLGLPALFRRKKPEDKTSQSGFWSSVRSWLWPGAWLLDALGRRKTYLETNVAHTQANSPWIPLLLLPRQGVCSSLEGPGSQFESRHSVLALAFESCHFCCKPGLFLVCQRWKMCCPCYSPVTCSLLTCSPWAAHSIS